MWNHFEAEDIVEKDRFIDKLKLVKDFLRSKCETTLSGPVRAYDLIASTFVEVKI